MASRKQFIEYKLKLATRVGSDGSSSSAGGVSAADRAALIAELTEVQANLEALVRQYERRFGEPYLRMTPAGPETAAPATPSHNGTYKVHILRPSFILISALCMIFRSIRRDELSPPAE